MRALFDDDQFTQLEWSLRQALEGKPLAQWLHAFYATHASAHPMKISNAARALWSEVARTCDFKKKLVKALEAIAAVSAKHGQHFGFEFDGDLVCVSRSPSVAQRRHLAKKSKAPR